MQVVLEERFQLRDGDAVRLRAMSRTHTGAASSARRARIVLLAAAGEPTSRIAELVGVSPATVRLWLARYTDDGVLGLVDNPRIGRPARIDPHRVLASTFAVAPAPQAGAARTTRELAETLGISYATVARVWREHGVRPLRVGGWELLAEPAFTVRQARLVGLFATRREAAIVLQAVDRPQRRPVPPARRGPVTGTDWADSLHQVHGELETLLGRLATGDPHSRPGPDLRSFQNQVRRMTPERGAHVVVHRYDSRRPLPPSRMAADLWVQPHAVASTAAWSRFCLGALHLSAQGTRLAWEDPWWPDLLRALRIVNGARQEVDYFTWWRPRDA